MREYWIGNNSMISELEGAVTCEYIVLIQEAGNRFLCESYGIKIFMQENEESAEVWDITVNPERILELGTLLCRNAVTPCTLLDVISDWL
jgi:hypothetical protein